MIKINDLTKGEIYSFFVVSRNENGTSLPSSVLTLNISEAAWNGVNIKGSQLTDTNRKLFRFQTEMPTYVTLVLKYQHFIKVYLNIFQ